MSLDMVLTVCKDASIFVGAATLLWGIFLFLKAATDTAKALPGFMASTTASLTNMGAYMEKAVDNHLTHIESGIGELAVSSSKTADGIETLQSDFREYTVKDAQTQAVVLERLKR